MEILAKPGVGGIIEQTFNGVHHILLQVRYKDDVPLEAGLIEIPGGKVRAFENIFDCLRREIFKETGLEVLEIEGSTVVEVNGYRVISYAPFACFQNLIGDYPIMVQTFLCKAQGEVVEQTDEAKNARWVSVETLKEMLKNGERSFYPMDIAALKKYVTYIESRI